MTVTVAVTLTVAIGVNAMAVTTDVSASQVQGTMNAEAEMVAEVQSADATVGMTNATMQNTTLVADAFPTQATSLDVNLVTMTNQVTTAATNPAVNAPMATVAANQAQAPLLMNPPTEMIPAATVPNAQT